MAKALDQVGPLVISIENDLNDLDGTVQEALRPYLQETLHKNNEQERKEIVFDEYYDEDSKREKRTEARS